MAYWIHEAGNKNNSLWRFFMCDSLSNLRDLPTATKEGQPQENDTVCKNKCAPGSQCLCLEDGSVWLLGKDTDQWIKRVSNSSGVSSVLSNTEPDSNTQLIGDSWVQEY
ncbi:MAG: hypothetical protein NC541_08505 [bacterium]|nr:hypothetical protein [bacterium]